MSLSIDFIMDLPFLNGNNAIFIFGNRLTKYCRLLPDFVGREL